MAPENVAQKLIRNHLHDGTMRPGETIGLKIDQTLTQDATGTTVMLEFEALGLPRVRTELSAQYVDHNLLQVDFKNADDHVYLRTACQKFGIWYSGPGNGVSHPVHMERFGIPGKTLLGSDSHTPAAGSLGMLAIGAGGLEVAMAMAGEPYHIEMPQIMGVHLTGKLPDWVSAKDIILEMLRRYTVEGGVGKIIEYHGPGLKHLTAMDRHVIANMGAELGATTTVFPADDAVRAFLETQGRAQDFVPITADPGCTYDLEDEINLSALEPLIALPSSPGNVRRVAEVAGLEVYQAYIGSSANPGLRDFAIPAMMVDGKRVHDRVSFDINPTSRQILENMTAMGFLGKYIAAGARIHQAGCNGCIGMGQAPATKHISLRTTPRNFPGRSGTKEDKVYLCSPETAAAAALTGVITDPRTLDMPYPRFEEPKTVRISLAGLIQPPESGSGVELVKGPNIAQLPEFGRLKETMEGPVLLKMGRDISTDEIMPAGARVLPLRSNIPKISEFSFSQIEEDFYKRALKYQKSGFCVVAGENYGQGSSREHAAIAPRYLGLEFIVARSFARIHRENLINFGIIPLCFTHPEDLDRIKAGDILKAEHTHQAIKKESGAFKIYNVTQGHAYETHCELSNQQKDILLAGGRINLVKHKHA